MCSKDKEQDKLKAPTSPEQRVTRPLSLCHNKTIANISELSQAACLAPFPSHIKEGIHPTGNMWTLPNRQVTHKSLCSLAIKTDKQPMLIVDFPWLPGSRLTVLAATLLFNKFYLPYILPCVWKFFSNPCSDHDTCHSVMPPYLLLSWHLSQSVILFIVSLSH